MFIFMLLVVGLFIIAIVSFTLDEDSFVGIVSTVVLIVMVVFSFGSYLSHSDNLGTIRGQKEVIAVYVQRVSELNSSLQQMIPEAASKNQTVLNADSPVSGLIKAVAQANEDLTKSRTQLAEAKVSIAKRKAGPFRFIVNTMGEE